MNISSFQPWYVRKTTQGLHCIAALRPHPIMEMMMLVMIIQTYGFFSMTYKAKVILMKSQFCDYRLLYLKIR